MGISGVVCQIKEREFRLLTQDWVALLGLLGEPFAPGVEKFHRLELWRDQVRVVGGVLLAPPLVSWIVGLLDCWIGSRSV